LKKLVYLISPNKIDQNFYTSLDKVLSFKNVKFFQLRLKNVSQKKLINISKKIKRITTKHKVNFIINDYYLLTSKIKADGCHMGQLDGSVKIARKKLKGKILGITCHNSKNLEFFVDLYFFELTLISSTSSKLFLPACCLITLPNSLPRIFIVCDKVLNSGFILDSFCIIYKFATCCVKNWYIYF